ncbi:MAG: hypothetical protein WCG73_00055, partial [Candidatus Moraniibacteriota bacterium]
EESAKEHEYLVSLEEKLMQGLKIPYQVINICAGDLGAPAAKKFDIDLVLYLVKTVVSNDPTKNCRVKGKREDWIGMPKSKSLFCAKEGKGFPIGNLTSQLFGNIYLDGFDHFVQEKMGVKWYGRYVDDMVFISCDKEFLKAVISRADDYLQKELTLTLHPKKIHLQEARHGVSFWEHLSNRDEFILAKE